MGFGAESDLEWPQRSLTEASDLNRLGFGLAFRGPQEEDRAGAPLLFPGMARWEHFPGVHFFPLPSAPSPGVGVGSGYSSLGVTAFGSPSI